MRSLFFSVLSRGTACLNQPRGLPTAAICSEGTRIHTEIRYNALFDVTIGTRAYDFTDPENL